MLFMRSDVIYQMNAKYVQINHIDNEHIIQEFIDDNYIAYSGYTKVYFVDLGMKVIGFDAIFSYKTEGKQFIIISDKARNNKDIQKIYDLAIEKVNGYSLLCEQDDISIVIYNGG